MNNNISIKIKAALLIVVFSLNTIVGFACAVGLKMGYNDQHHTKDAAVVHPNEKMVIHGEHHKPGEKAHQHDSSPKSSPDDCCSNSVTSFSLLEKSVAPQVNLVHPVFTSSFLAVYSALIAIQSNPIPKNIRAFAQSYHPPDIRIAIQLFQI